MYGQENLELTYNLNNCDGTASGSFSADALIEGNPDCTCGIDSDALGLGGNNDRILIPDTAEVLLVDDFTLRFYVQVDNNSGNVDLFSYRASCDLDSSMSISYIPITNSLQVEFAENFDNIFSLDGMLNTELCWNEIVVTKFNLRYSLYVDGELQAEEEASRTVPFGVEAEMAFSNSPCLAFTQDRLNGKIDEIDIFNYAISPQEIEREYAMPDQILTADTTIFIGEMVDIFTGPTCASQVTWTPSEGLNDDMSFDPTATGIETTVYTATFQDNGCITSDEIIINVVDPDDLNCENLLLPSSFTPNNDGLNDIYTISNRFLIDRVITFEIYDRWGAMVFETSDKNAGWDGSFNGNQTDPGMYIYKVKYICGGQEFLKVDNFNVLR